MCDANIMGGVGAIGSIAGAFGSYNASNAQAQMMRQLGAAQRQAYDAAADITEQNVLITGKAAEIEASRGAASLSILRSRGRSTISSQRAAMGASGLATTSGTPALILEDTAASLALDVEAHRLNNRRTKWGYDVQATNYRNQARQQRYAGQMAEIGANYQADVTQQAATTSLLSGVTASLFKYGDGIGAWSKTSSAPKTVSKASSWRRSG